MNTKLSSQQGSNPAKPKISDAMVTARMGAAKKSEAIAVLEASGLNASSAINALFDYIITNNSMPNLSTTTEETRPSLKERMKDAAEWFNGIDLTISSVVSARERA